MAIALDIIQARRAGHDANGRPLPLIELPALKVLHVIVAGDTEALQKGAHVISLRNRGDAVWVKLEVVGDATDAGPANDQSVHLAATDDQFDFALPARTDASQFRLSVQAG